MNAQGKPSNEINLHRRHFLVGASALAALTAAACSNGPGDPTPTLTDGSADPVAELLPDYNPVEFVAPDFPSINGTTPIYKTYPSELATSVEEPPGNGSSFTLMVPASGGIPPGLPGNAYFAAMNEALGANITVNAFDLSTAEERYATVLASPGDVASWTVVPAGARPPRFDEAVEACFEDLTSFLAGSNVESYPNLANIRTETWQGCVFNDKLMGLPYPNANINGGILYFRKDIFDSFGLEPPQSADDLFEIATELTEPSQGRWAADNIWGALLTLYAVPPLWKIDNGKLISRYETDEYAEALAFNTRLYSAGLVHPDAVSQSGSPDARFIAGNTTLQSSGIGKWREHLVNTRGSVDGFEVQATPLFAPEGGTPLRYVDPPINMNSFIKKGTPPEQVEELLGIANFLAAPFGTREFQLVRYGLEGTHHTINEHGAPVQTERFQQEYRGTFLFPCAPERPEAEASMPDYLDALGEWLEDTQQYLQEPAFYGRSIIEPGHLSGLAQQMTDFENDVFTGRTDLSRLPDAIEGWRSSGGDELREFYAEHLEG